MSDLIRRALDTNQAFLAMGNEVFQAERATFVRNRSVSRIHDSNHVASITASTPEEVGRLLARAEQEFSGYRHRRFDVDAATPALFEARLAHDGYRASEALVMVLEGDLLGEAKPHEIRQVNDDAGWEAYATLHEIDWHEYNDRLREDVWSAREMLNARRVKSPPARFWLAYVEGEPRSYLASWEGLDGVGQVEDLFTHPDFRHRGLATALIHHCLADCRSRGAGPVVIVADPTDTPRLMYAAMGFRPVAIKRNYGKDLDL